MLKHAEDGVQQLAHDGDQGLHFKFGSGQRMLVKGAQVGIVLHRNQGGHMESR